MAIATPEAPTRQPTLKQLLTAARKVWKNAVVEHNPKAPDRETRELMTQQNRDDRDRMKEIDTLLKEKPMTTLLRRFADAGKFVCDVDGGAPSIDELRPVVADAERYFALKDEWASLNDAVKKRHPYWKRFQVGTDDNIGGLWMRTIHADADTAAELMDAILAKGKSRHA